VIENLSPEAERRLTLKRLVLTETELTQLRKLGAAEARWRIEHDHKIQTEWLARRREFMLADCCTPKMKAPKPKPTNGAVVIVQRRTTAAVLVADKRA
jgi:hypothetical protein